MKQQIAQNIVNLIKGQTIELKSAVGIVLDKNNNLLLGLAIADDERDGKWVFPGGGIDKGENALQSAIREVYEEAGITTKPLHTSAIIHPAKPFVGFFVLKVDDVKPQVYHNDEFSEMKWFTPSKLPKDTLSINIDILKILTNGRK